MVEVSYSAEATDLDRAAHEAEAERPGKPIIVRVQPTIFRTGTGTSGQQKAWAGVSWRVTCRHAAEAIDLRDALRVFFETVTRTDAATVIRALRQAVAEPIDPTR